MLSYHNNWRWFIRKGYWLYFALVGDRDCLCLRFRIVTACVINLCYSVCSHRELAYIKLTASEFHIICGSLSAGINIRSCRACNLDILTISVLDSKVNIFLKICYFWSWQCCIGQPYLLYLSRTAVLAVHKRHGRCFIFWDGNCLRCFVDRIALRWAVLIYGILACRQVGNCEITCTGINIQRCSCSRCSCKRIWAAVLWTAYRNVLVISILDTEIYLLIIRNAVTCFYCVTVGIDPGLYNLACTCVTGIGERYRSCAACCYCYRLADTACTGVIGYRAVWILSVFCNGIHSCR